MNQEAESALSAEKFVVRLPRGMRKTIAESAGKNRRSMNSEIVAIIARSLGRASEQLHNGGDESQCFDATLSHVEMEMLNCFRGLPEQRRRALLDFLL